MILKVKKIVEEAKITQAYDGDCYDLYSTEELKLKAGARGSVGVGIAIQLPKGYRASVLPRSGISLKSDILVITGTIDQNYRGEIRAILLNTCNDWTKETTIEKGCKIAQLKIEKIEHCDIEFVSKLDETDRGMSGFGSSGY